MERARRNWRPESNCEVSPGSPRFPRCAPTGRSTACPVPGLPGGTRWNRDFFSRWPSERQSSDDCGSACSLRFCATMSHRTCVLAMIPPGFVGGGRLSCEVSGGGCAGILSAGPRKLLIEAPAGTTMVVVVDSRQPCCPGSKIAKDRAEASCREAQTGTLSQDVARVGHLA